MSFFSILGTLLIKPLQLLFEVVFVIANRVVGDPGLSIIALSLAMNFLVLPLYMRADAMQEDERQMELRLHKGVSHIKKTFRGDERMMMLQTYYRQNDYKPTYVLKGATSLFLEIPFFIAAYTFLSGLELLHGVSFGPITDLGKPDGLLAIGGLTINVLPIIMTAINLISCIIFTKGSLPKTKIQLYAMALFFLVFLYTSPAGLVFYWTLNNLFSLIKTIFYKLKHAEKILAWLACVCGVACAGFGICCYGTSSPLRLAFFIGLGVVLQLPILSSVLKKKRAPRVKKEPHPDKRMFISGGVFLSVLMGALIPSAVINSSPQEFVDMAVFCHPAWYIVSAFCLAFGTFVIWCGIFYWLANPSGKEIMDKAIWALCGVAIVNYMFFGRGLGNLSSSLKFDDGMFFTAKQMLINLAVVLAVAAVLYIAAGRWKKHIPGIIIVGIIALVCMSVINSVGIFKSVDALIENGKDDDARPHMELSKNGKNVIVIMLDRGMGAYIPYIFNEKPELQAQFDGFTYYNNVTSLGFKTNLSVPSLFGGYEYTPAKMNARDDELLMYKHNEAISVLPVLFANNGYNVTFFDPVYANYQYVPDLTIFDGYENIHAYNTKDQFTEPRFKETSISNNKRNFFCYSLMKSSPLCIQQTLYSYGSYNRGNAGVDEGYGGQTEDGLFKASGLSPTFMGSYNTLCNLSNVTHITKNGNNLFIMTNDTTHEPAMLQEPDYVPAQNVDNTQYEEEHADRFTVNGRTMTVDELTEYTHYQANVAALIQLGNWFDYLRANGVYNNTRIIIVSDHGQALGQFEELMTDDGLDAEGFFSLMLVKDFDAKGFKTSDKFMTAADTPTLATQGVIQNPVNPFTGNVISSNEKTEHDQYVFFSYSWSVEENCGKQYVAGDWYTVHDSIWDKNNWQLVGKDTILTKED